MGDEELAAVGVGAGVGHGQDPALVADAVAGLVLEGIARAAGAGPPGTAALDHEVRNDPVEVQAVVEALPGQVHEAGDGHRGLVGEELDGDLATVGVENGVQGHGVDSWEGPRSIMSGSPQKGPSRPALTRHEVRLSRCPSNASAISPSSPTSTTARPPSSTSC